VSVPTLTVVGRAERDVVPDRVVVSVAVRTSMLPSPQEALGRCTEARRRLLDDLRAAHPSSTVSDGRIATQAEQRRVKIDDELDGYTEERWEIDGYTGHCLVTLEDDAAAAAAIVASAGTHPDAERVFPAFVVSRALGRQTAGELEQEAVRDALDRAHGLAAAAGMAVGPVLAIGEPGPPAQARFDEVYPSPPRSMSTMSAGEVEDSLGELRPEPETRADRVTVRVALVAAERA
jgi:uncharacterized protein YggE